MANSFLNYLGYLQVYFVRLIWGSSVSGLSDYDLDDKSVVGSDIKLNFENVLFHCPPSVTFLFRTSMDGLPYVGICIGKSTHQSCALNRCGLQNLLQSLMSDNPFFLVYASLKKQIAVVTIQFKLFSNACFAYINI